ncbi:MAG: hypothetical protein WA733_10390 [Methylocystis sp.]
MLDNVCIVRYKRDIAILQCHGAIFMPSISPTESNVVALTKRPTAKRKPTRASARTKKPAKRTAPDFERLAPDLSFEHLTGVHPEIVKKLRELIIDIGVEAPGRAEFITKFTKHHNSHAVRGFLSVVLRLSEEADDDSRIAEHDFVVWCLHSGDYVMSLDEHPDREGDHVGDDAAFIGERPHSNRSKHFLSVLELRIRNFFAEGELYDLERAAVVAA